MVEQILELRAKGYRHSRIAEKLGINEETVKARLEEAHKAARDRLGDLVNQRQHEHDGRLEWLWSVCAAELEAGNLSMIKSALTILERQSKLLGLDVRPMVGGNGYEDDKWYACAPVQAVLDAGEKMGMSIQRFKT